MKLLMNVTRKVTVRSKWERTQQPKRIRNAGSSLDFRLLLLVLIGTVPMSSPAQSKKHQEQSRFGAEIEIKHPVRVNEIVLTILRSDKRNQTCLQDGESPKKIASSWFVASIIHLDNDSRPDLVVTASNPCLLGANMVPFWIFRNTPHGYDLILQT